MNSVMVSVTAQPYRGLNAAIQSAFPICSDYGSEAIVLLIFDQKNFLVFDFFAHITMYLMTSVAVYRQK